MINNIALFFFIFGVPFVSIPLNSSKILFILSFTLFLLKYHKHERVIYFVPRTLLVMIALILILIMASVVYPLLHLSADYSVLYNYVIMLFEACLGSYLFVCVFFHQADFEKIIKSIIIISVAQSIIILLMLSSENFRDFIYLFANIDSESLTERYGGFRGFGLAGSVTYDLSVFLSFSLIFISVLVVQNKADLFKSITAWLLIFSAILITGRTGFIGVFISIALLCLFIKRGVSFNFLIYLLLAVGLLVFSGYLYFQQTNPEFLQLVIVKIIPYAFEMFINLFESGDASTTSTEILKKMYFPISERTIFFGDGYYKSPVDEGEYYMKTDAGYMRHILFYGFVPIVILVSLYAYGFFEISKIFPNKMLRITLFLILFLCYIIVHYKGDFLLGSSMNIKLFMILLVHSILFRRGRKFHFYQFK